MSDSKAKTAAKGGSEETEKRGRGRPRKKPQEAVSKPSVDTSPSKAQSNAKVGKLFATKEYIEGLLLENCGHINKPGTNRKPEEPSGSPTTKRPRGRPKGATKKANKEASNSKKPGSGKGGSKTRAAKKQENDEEEEEGGTADSSEEQ